MSGGISTLNGTCAMFYQKREMELVEVVFISTTKRSCLTEKVDYWNQFHSVEVYVGHYVNHKLKPIGQSQLFIFRFYPTKKKNLFIFGEKYS